MLIRQFGEFRISKTRQIFDLKTYTDENTLYSIPMLRISQNPQNGRFVTSLTMRRIVSHGHPQSEGISTIELSEIVGINNNETPAG